VKQSKHYKPKRESLDDAIMVALTPKELQVTIHSVQGEIALYRWHISRRPKQAHLRKLGHLKNALVGLEDARVERSLREKGARL
jgi:hypothetical protein